MSTFTIPTQKAHNIDSNQTGALPTSSEGNVRDENAEQAEYCQESKSDNELSDINNVFILED